MRTLASFTAVVLGALAVATAAGAAQNSAHTDLLLPPSTPPTSGTTLSVQFTVFGGTPVVPYEYALENVCITPGQKGGSFTIGQHDPIVYWTDQDPQGNPQVTMPVYLESVPAGSTCKVSLVRNNTAVKGSTVAYTVS
jgi:hypothetical protein